MCEDLENDIFDIEEYEPVSEYFYDNFYNAGKNPSIKKNVR